MTYAHLLRFLAKFFLEWEIFRTKLCRRNQNTHLMFSNFYFRKSCHLWDNVDKFWTARQNTDDDVTRRMRIICWVPKATDTHSEYVTLIVFLRQKKLRERALVSVIRTLPSLYIYIYIYIYVAVLQIGRSLLRSQLESLEFFIDIKSFRSHYDPGVDSASNGNEYQEYFLEVRLTTLPPSCAVVTKSGNFNFLEPSGPVQACNGTALPLYIYM